MTSTSVEPSEPTAAVQAGSVLIRARYSETDQMGVVYHGAYFPWFELGRTELLRIAGFPYRDLENQEITALYSTPYERTRETLLPLVEGKGLELLEYPAQAKEEWLAKLFEDHAGGTVVISGHSNTIPGLANLLLGSETFTQFDDNDYSNLLVIVGSKVGNGTLVRLKF